MNTIFSIFATSAICLLLVGVIIVVVIYLVVRKSREALSDLSNNNSSASETTNQTSNNDGDTRWSRGNLNTIPLPPPIAEASQPCPACGAQNLGSAGVCTSCGSKLK